VFGWFAHIFIHPAEKCGTSLVLRGDQGVGKTIVGETFGHLLGIHYKLVAEPRYVTGRFNAHLEGCLLLHCDEAFWAGDHVAEGKIKDLVTGKHQLIERKGYETVVVANHVRLFVNGNANWLVPAGTDERRFAVLHVGAAHKQDHRYFGAIVAELQAGGYERLLYELLTFDLSQVNLRVIPMTTALLDQKIASLPAEQAWWLDVLKNGSLPGCALPPHRCPRPLLFDHYTYHAQIVGERRRNTETQLGIFLHRIIPGLTDNRETYIHEDAKHRWRIYNFPPLATCREAFARELQQDIDWGEPEEWEREE
jgi:Family of unknown function (DUF5906)